MVFIGSADDNAEDKNNAEDENNEEDELNDIRNNILNEVDIKSKLELYTELFKCISLHTKKRKEGLNLYYSWLNSIHFFVNVSIITLSAASTFIQSLVPDYDDYAVFRIILLSITTYTGLALAISKFYKLDDKKENTNSLRDRFTELQTKVKFHTDSLAPWESGSHYKKLYNEKNKDNNNKETEWISLVNQIESEYMNIIDCKRELNSNYEKLLEKGTTKNYISKYKDKKKIKKKALGYDNEIKNIKLDNAKLKELLEQKAIQSNLEYTKKEIESESQRYDYFNNMEINNISENISDNMKINNISENISDNIPDNIPDNNSGDNLKPDNP